MKTFLKAAYMILLFVAIAALAACTPDDGPSYVKPQPDPPSDEIQSRVQAVDIPSGVDRYSDVSVQLEDTPLPLYRVMVNPSQRWQGDAPQRVATGAGYFSLDEVAYAIFETNGQLSVVPHEDGQKAVLPVPFIVDGQWSEEDVKYYGIDKDKMQAVFEKNGVEAEHLLVATLDDDGKMVLHPDNGKYFVLHVEKSEVCVD